MPIVSENAATSLIEPSARKVRLFRNGANQAVRIPKEFELPTQDATIRRVGSTLVIEPVAPQFTIGSAADLLAVLATMEPIDEEFPDVDEGLLPMEDVDL